MAHSSNAAPAPENKRHLSELEAILQLAKQDVPDREQIDFAAFLSALYQHAHATDLAQEPPDRHAARALALWRWGQQQTAFPVVRILNPPESGSWREDFTHLEIITRDSPFLVDSITNELTRLGLEIRLFLHPVFGVSRNAQGAISAFATHREKDLPRESWMHISLARQPAEAHEGIREAVQRVLTDVAAAVADWAKMRAAVRESVAELSAGKDDDSAEAAAFLDWLDDNHFVFLGMRDYRLGQDGDSLEIIHDRSLGLLRDPGFHIFNLSMRLREMTSAMHHFLAEPTHLFVNKARSHSTVHRAGPFDIVGIKHFDAKGTFIGFRLFAGLFTSAAYARSAEEIPLLRRKVAEMLRRSGLDPSGHSGKALAHILNTYPRDDLFQIGLDNLYPIVRGILTLAERQRTALFVWKDPFDRFWSCLIYTPRERYDSQLRRRLIGLVEEGLGGTCLRFTTVLSDSPLVRLQAFIEILPERAEAPAPDLAAIEARLIEAARGWDEKLTEALVIGFGEDRGLALRREYLNAFSTIYRESVTPQQAVRDLLSIEKVDRDDSAMALALAGVPDAPQRLELRLFHKDAPLALSDILPPLENLGLRVLTEVPYELAPRAGGKVWVQEIEAETCDGRAVDAEVLRANFLEAGRALWGREIEDDGFNRLILLAGLAPREVVILRAYAKYLQQAGFTGSQAFLQDTLAAHPAIAAGLVKLFQARFDPAAALDGAALAADLHAELDRVENLAEDEALRRFLNLIESTLRTNYYLNKPYLSFKLDSQQVTGLPLPRPLVEIWVYSVRMEGCHLRGGRVARGGLRWSDRRDDFRTEILGLMKAQMVKNSVIVPVGSKGGFYCKKLPADPKAVREEVVACYQTLIRGLLDLTDSNTMDGIRPPEGVLRRDGDDPYLVVAADKGTATFSDIANALSADYGFWLDDAFASGGSAGYDHKQMGITARGAWEAVKRHFRELGTDIQTQPFTCVGVGDMAGDVFGNGMLLSEQTRLVAAFNHRHIFLDPAPDPAVSYAERQRLFALPGSQWSDYDPKKLSAGGGIYERSAKAIALTPEVRQRLGLEAERLTPAELIRAILKAPVDLLYLGGIGTYVKASDETQADVSDKANDALRVNAAELCAKVVGEGANLGLTPRARIEYARAGGRLNSDAIDNSAGVDTSDHEVNIKIALASELDRGSLTRAARNQLLTEMTDEVAALVLRDNYLQTQILSLEQLAAPQLADAHARLMRTLEKAGRLDRAVENLPSGKQLAARAGEGLTRPEIAILLAHAKLALFDELIQSTLPDDPAVRDELFAYFPRRMQADFRPAIESHRLRREIIATVLANDVVNRMGATFVFAMAERSGYAPVDVVRAWRVVRGVYELPGLWAEVEALDNQLPAATQLELLARGMRLAERAVGTVLTITSHPLDITALVARLKPALAELGDLLPVPMLPGLEELPTALRERLVRLDALASGPDILVVAAEAEADLSAAARIYAAVDERFGFSQLRAQAFARPLTGHWQRQAVAAAVDDLFATQQELAVSVLRHGEGDLAVWAKLQESELARFDALRDELSAAPELDLAMLTVAGKALRGLAEI